MILEIQHETHLKYSDPVTESITEVRMEPVSDDRQSCHSFHLAVQPLAERFRYQDGFGNRVHHFNLHAPHDQVRILAASIVETYSPAHGLDGSQSTWPLDLSAEIPVLDFLPLRGPVRRSQLLDGHLNALRPAAGTPLADLVLRTARYIGEHFQYARDVTLVSSPIDDLLEKGQGVCQDFTHLMIALLRSLEIPARYVSGYIHRPNKDSQSHAWCEVWFPDQGWVGIDPTNNRPVDEHFVKVAIGRDFTDVPPNRGIYRGAAAESIFVRVETRTLERLPALSWQDQLPPLNVPLTAIVPRFHGLSLAADQEQPQQ